MPSQCTRMKQNGEPRILKQTHAGFQVDALVPVFRGTRQILAFRVLPLPRYGVSGFIGATLPSTMIGIVGGWEPRTDLIHPVDHSCRSVFRTLASTTWDDRGLCTNWGRMIAVGLRARKAMNSNASGSTTLVSLFFFVLPFSSFSLSRLVVVRYQYRPDRISPRDILRSSSLRHGEGFHVERS